MSLWAVRALAAKGPLPGRAELLLLVYGVETALTTLTCMYDAALWDPAVVTAAQKRVLIGGLYGGYFALGEFAPVVLTSYATTTIATTAIWSLFD